MSALPSMRPCPRPPVRAKKRCSPVSADRTQGALGVRYDSTTGLHYMRQRWYDSSLGRFISRDPIGINGGANLYAYCGNSPLNFVDPSGLDTLTIGRGLIQGGARLAGAAIAGSEVAAGAAGITVAIPIGILGIGIADNMRPVPGAGAGVPHFPDTMGDDRWSNRQYEARSESNENYEERAREQRKKLAPYGESRAPMEDTEIPYKPKKSPSEIKGRPSKRNGPKNKSECITSHLKCLANIANSIGTNALGQASRGTSDSLAQKASRCNKTKENCENACGGGEYWVESEFWP